MRVAYFLTFFNPAGGAARVEDRDLARFTDIVAATPDLERALIFTPASAHDPFLNDGAPPRLAIELYFSDIAALEAALAPRGHLQALAAADRFPSLAGTQMTQQAMLVRPFAVPDPNGPAACTYLVSYEGVADDLNAWLSYYIEHHPPLMTRMPGIRDMEICTRIDWCSFLPWPRVDYMQRNKTVFDTPAALTAALNSPIREEMRRDFAHFPPFAGKASHYPMTTRALAL
jgi:uncharacterized protein (TIGR02118 family)